MNDINTVAERYIAIWNETDPARRRALVAAGWTEHASYIDPLMSAQGREQLDALVAAVHARFPGHVFKLKGQPDGYGDHVRFSWTLGAPGTSPVARGTDFASVDDGGRLRSVTGFLDQVSV